jgi:hypothetical protein
VLEQWRYVCPHPAARAAPSAVLHGLRLLPLLARMHACLSCSPYTFDTMMLLAATSFVVLTYHPHCFAAITCCAMLCYAMLRQVAPEPLEVLGATAKLRQVLVPHRAALDPAGKDTVENLSVVSHSVSHRPCVLKHRVKASTNWPHILCASLLA